MVVVDRYTAQLAIEVKTDLNDATFSHMIDVHVDASWAPIPCLGFAYDGWTFDTFVAKMSEAIRTSLRGVPDCIAVHSKNYFFIRSPYVLTPTSEDRRRHQPAEDQYAVNFGEINKGRASAMFLQYYLRLLQEKYLMDHPTLFTAERLGVTKEHIVKFMDNGEIA